MGLVSGKPLPIDLNTELLDEYTRKGPATRESEEARRSLLAFF
jgi:hypothetical protein